MSQKQTPPNIDIAALGGVMGQVGCLVVLLVGLALGAGMLLDRWLGTEPILTVILMLGSVPVSLYLTIRVSLRAAKRIQDAADASKKTEDEATI